jgi:hypothetical protein
MITPMMVDTPAGEPIRRKGEIMRAMVWVGIISCLSLVGVASGQEQGWAAKFFQGNLQHDFGNVPWGAQLTHKFTITNIYNVPFMVEDARVSCGCVSVKKPTGVIPPRGIAELEANMDTRKAGATGKPKVVNIFVKLTSVPQSPGDKIYTSSCTLTVSCLAQGNIRYSHEKLHFGVVNLGAPATAVLDIEHFTNPAFEITGVVNHHHPVDVSVQRATPRMGGRVAYRVVAQLRKEAPAGEIKYEVQLNTNDRTTPILDVVMEGIIQAPLVASPNQINLGNVKVQEIVSGRVILRGPAGQSFRILGVDGQGDGLTVKVPEKAATAHLLVVEFVPQQAGKITKTLTIKTDLAGDLSAQVTVEGNGVP